MDPVATGAPALPRLHVAHILHNLGPGGAQELLVTLAANAASADLEISVVSLTSAHGLEHSRRLNELGVRVVSLGLTSLRDVRGPHRLVHMIGRLQPDVLHTHGKHADLLAAMTAPLARVPRVSTLHLVEEASSAGDRAVFRMLALGRRLGGGHTVMVSQYQRDRYVAANPRAAASTSVLYNGVPAPPPGEAGDQPHVDDRPHVLALGLLRPDRGHRTLIDAAVQLSPRVVVDVAGDGPLRDELVARARENKGHGAEVRFLGYRRDFTALLRRADLLVHPSVTDALPTAVIHALAHGVPVVASSVGGIPEIVSPDVGVLVPPGNSRVLAARVTELLSDDARLAEMGAAGRARHAEVFSAEGWAIRLRQCYADVRSRPPVPSTTAGGSPTRALDQ